MQRVYDTCSLLENLHHAFEHHFYISNITLKELESIKTSAHKDPNVKFKARRLINLLNENEEVYTIINYHSAWDEDIKKSTILSDNDDSRIIITACKLAEKEDIVFITQDLCCKQLAKSMGLNVEYLADKKQDYTGYQEIICKNDTELAQWYEKIYTGTKIDDLLLNEYLILKDSFGNPLDSYKNTEEGLVKVNYNNFQSKMFGKVKAKDEYQKIAMDSLVNNKITMLRGTAGTGKSYLAIGYLFYLLDKHKIDKIIIFCNTVAASGAAKLGFYPGSRTEKLLDSQVGNFLSSKLGDRFEAERMIADGYIELLPLADIRGYDTTGLNAGIYIQEAQNLDIELMKLALQRIGEDSICILDGDSDTQLDLPIYAGDNNGMRRVSEIFRGDSSYGEVTLKTIHRSHIATLADRM